MINNKNQSKVIQQSQRDLAPVPLRTSSIQSRLFAPHHPTWLYYYYINHFVIIPSNHYHFHKVAYWFLKIPSISLQQQIFFFFLVRLRKKDDAI